MWKSGGRSNTLPAPTHRVQKSLPILTLKLALFGFASIRPQSVVFLHNALSKLSLPEFCPAGKLALF